jgi:hypothetical protein
MLAGFSMHAQQRASMMPAMAQSAVGASMNSIGGASRAEETANGASSFATPAMRAMLLRSRKAREASAEQPPPEAGEETGSLANGISERARRGTLAQTRYLRSTPWHLAAAYVPCCSTCRLKKQKKFQVSPKKKKTEMQNAKGFRHLLDFPFEKKILFTVFYF